MQIKYLIGIAAVIFFISYTVSAFAAKPLAGISGIENNSPRGSNMAPVLEGHLVNALTVSGIFDLVNVPLLKDQLNRFNCYEEICQLRVSKDAGFNILIRGSIDDRGDYIILKLAAFGLDIPYNGKIIYNYTVKIPMTGEFAPKEFSYITEEHSGHFLSGLLNVYRLKASLDYDGENVKFDFEENIDGKFHIYTRLDSADGTSGKFKSIKGTFVNRVLQDKNIKIKKGDFVLLEFKRKSEYFSDFFYGRKKEIVFNKFSGLDTFYTFLLAAPASALMPLVSPLLGYYKDSDWPGLAMWTINYPAYFYLMMNGFINNPDIYKKTLSDIPRESTAGNAFSWYMLFAGGLPLFVDSFAQQYLKDASNYQGVQPLMGNSLTAGFLALIGGGGGHFYRGERFWGYVYFHLNNLLLYFMILELTPSEKYNYSLGYYVKQDINYTNGYILIGIYSAVKIAEVIHAVLTRDKIRNGAIVEEGFTFEPIISIDKLDKNTGMIFGLQYVYRF